jgi:hypothetical protein
VTKPGAVTGSPLKSKRWLTGSSCGPMRTGKGYSDCSSRVWVPCRLRRMSSHSWCGLRAEDTAETSHEPSRIADHLPIVSGDSGEPGTAQGNEAPCFKSRSVLLPGRSAVGTRKLLDAGGSGSFLRPCPTPVRACGRGHSKTPGYPLLKQVTLGGRLATPERHSCANKRGELETQFTQTRRRKARP